MKLREREVFIDVDWTDSIDDRKSTTEYCTFVMENLTSWRGKKQNIIVRSSVETEF